MKATQGVLEFVKVVEEKLIDILDIPKHVILVSCLLHR